MARIRPRWEQDLIRQEVFHWLAEQARNGHYLHTRQELFGFTTTQGERIPLLDQSRGIRNPADFEATLSIMTSADRRRNPYGDLRITDGLIRYDYRSADHGDNRKLQMAAALRVPVVYFEQKLRAGPYYAHFPMIVHDDPGSRSVVLAFEDDIRFAMGLPDVPPEARRYAEVRAFARLHQDRFRDMVITAYNGQCAICRLRHERLLDAAHITPDSDVDSIVHVSNGLALCKIHHAAYDSKFLGISPDYLVQINSALLEEKDGPMLEHGLKEMHGTRLHLPSDPREWPDRDRLASRFDEFAA